jgi:hypothetical protein
MSNRCRESSTDSGSVTIRPVMTKSLAIRRAGIAIATATALLLSGCGSTPSTPVSNNPLPAGAANTTSAPAYGADIQAAKSLSTVLSQSAQRDTGGATLP